MERKAMIYEELLSKKFQVYQNYIDSKTKKKKVTGKTGKGQTGKDKKTVKK